MTESNISLICNVLRTDFLIICTSKQHRLSAKYSILCNLMCSYFFLAKKILIHISYTEMAQVESLRGQRAFILLQIKGQFWKKLFLRKVL